jgi:nitrite reductase/ring-hydroxylating ferredoxin subunit
VSRFLSVNSSQSSKPVRHSSPCDGCTTSRREFLGTVSLGALAAAVALELGAGSADAFPITFAEGTQVAANQRSFPIPAADGATIDHTEEVIVARLHQQVFAFNLAGPHENTALRWRAEDMRFQCPRHGSKYQPDGTFISGRATRNMDRFAVQRSGDAVVVDLNRLLRSDQQPALWAAAVVAL